MISSEGIELLERVKAAILAEPDHFDMDFWWTVPADGNGIHLDDNGCWIVDRSRQAVPDDAPLLGHMSGCGTTACIAGWTVALAGERVRPGALIEYEARRLVGYGQDPLHASAHARCPLFYVDDWPDWLKDAFEEAESPAEAAAVACEAIDLWIGSQTDPKRSFI